MNGSAVRVRAVGTALPGAPVDTAMLASRFNMTAGWEQWVESFVDVRTRHFGFDLKTGERQRTLADLGTEAGARALAASGLAPSDIDLVVLGTATPDMLMPATVNVVADRLGIDDVPSFQLQSGCSGALQALDVAHQMLTTGRHRNALVLGAETAGKHFDPNLDLQAADPSYAINLVLFGDGAGAAVLTTDDVPGAPTIPLVRVRLVGAGRAPGQVVRWYGHGDLRDPDGAPPVTEDYKAVEEHVPALARDVCRELLDEVGWTGDDLDYLLPPQLSGRMTQQIVRALDLPGAQPVSCVRETGNIGNATPFFQLERVLPKMTRGDRAICLSVESSKWIKAGFAVEKC